MRLLKWNYFYNIIKLYLQDNKKESNSKLKLLLVLDERRESHDFNRW